MRQAKHGTILHNQLLKDYINYRAYAASQTATQHLSAAAPPSYSETEKQLFPVTQAHHLKLLDILWLPFLWKQTHLYKHNLHYFITPGWFSVSWTTKKRKIKIPSFAFTIKPKTQYHKPGTKPSHLGIRAWRINTNKKEIITTMVREAPFLQRTLVSST